MQKAIFIDKGGKLRHDIRSGADRGLVVLEHQAVEGLQELGDKNYIYLAVTNKPQPGADYFTEQDFAAVESHIGMLLMENEISADGFSFSSHLLAPVAEKYDPTRFCQKPMPVLLKEAATAFNIDLEQSWMISEMPHDIEAGNRAGCKTILIDKGNKLQWLIDSEKRTPLFIAASISEAAILIVGNTSATEVTYNMSEQVKCAL